MKKIFLLLVLVLIACGKNEEQNEELFLMEELLIGTWEISEVFSQKESEVTDLSYKINDCNHVETLRVTDLDDAVWTSYFPWLDEPTIFCSERSERMTIRLIEDQLIIEEFNSETETSGRFNSVNELKIYRYHNTDPDNRLVFNFKKATN